MPATYALCADAEVTGAPFYVIQGVEGTAYRRAEQLESLGPERTRTIALRTVDTLAALHGVDPDAVGLGDFGRPAGFLARQVRRWPRQLDASRSRPLAGIDKLRGRLAAAAPDRDAAAIVYGDNKLDNLLVDRDDRPGASGRAGVRRPARRTG